MESLDIDDLPELELNKSKSENGANNNKKSKGWMGMLMSGLG